MGKNNNAEPFGATIQDIRNTENDLRNLIDARVTRNELEKHYATKVQVLLWGIISVVGLVSAYFYMNPHHISDKTINSKLDLILNNINSKK